jgi:hypothetical protein
MISAHSRSVGSCDRCVWAMVLCELAELALHSRRLPATTTTQPIQRERLSCLTWITLMFLHFAWGRTWEPCLWQSPSLSSWFRDRSCRGFSPTTGCDRLFPGNFATKIFQGKANFLAGDKDHGSVSQFSTPNAAKARCGLGRQLRYGRRAEVALASDDSAVLHVAGKEASRNGQQYQDT